MIDVHRGAASRLYLAFLNGKLEQKWMLEAVDHASLKVKPLAAFAVAFFVVAVSRVAPLYKYSIPGMPICLYFTKI